jgi:hypothetical protein
MVNRRTRTAPPLVEPLAGKQRLRRRHRLEYGTQWRSCLYPQQPGAFRHACSYPQRDAWFGDVDERTHLHCQRRRMPGLWRDHTEADRQPAGRGGNSTGSGERPSEVQVLGEPHTIQPRLLGEHGTLHSRARRVVVRQVQRDAGQVTQ